MSDLNKIVEELSGLTALEIADLTKMLEEKWGVTAVAAAAAPAAGGAAAAEGDERRQEDDAGHAERGAEAAADVGDHGAGGDSV